MADVKKLSICGNCYFILTLLGVCHVKVNFVCPLNTIMTFLKTNPVLLQCIRGSLKLLCYSLVQTEINRIIILFLSGVPHKHELTQQNLYEKQNFLTCHRYSVDDILQHYIEWLLMATWKVNQTTK